MVMKDSMILGLVVFIGQQPNTMLLVHTMLDFIPLLKSSAEDKENKRINLFVSFGMLNDLINGSGEKSSLLFCNLYEQ